MKHLKPIQILTDDAINLIERAKLHLEVSNNTIANEHTKMLINDLDELIKELKA
jgi:hypothetical protein